ncbi:MAG TPA: hypothetical protein VJX23_02970 [Candidatus Binataceae bacterium]|nr:hypothetical protein [Candidatus Binataceae bacterium]
MSKKKRTNAGAGYGYMFHGAFKDKKDAMAKERSTKGAWIKGVYTPQGHRYVVMSPRTNPRKTKPKAPKGNPSELLVMGANPHEITVPPGTVITIRTNPTNPPEHFSAAQARAGGHARPLGWSPFQKRIARMVRKASGSEGARLTRSYRRHKASGGPSRSASKVFHELYAPNPATCGVMIGRYPCTRKPGHKGPHLPQGATMRPRSRLRSAWKPNPSAAALHESFTGRTTRWTETRDEPCIPAGDYAQIGELLALYVKPRAGGQVQIISFASARPTVLAAENGRQLYFAGGDQDLSRGLGVFGALDRGANVCELGEARRIEYKQRKEHLPDPDHDEWRHDFGEETNQRPIALYDRQHKRILLEGGAYQVRPEGIVN